MPPLNLLIKPASGSCNMRCKYCFYADEMKNRAPVSRGRMSPETMHTLVDRAFAYADSGCTFAFQGGGPTLAGLPFFQDLTAYVSGHPHPRQVRYAFQTNGYALDEDWVRWFAENRVLVGISLDGPKELDDRYRVDAGGNGTFRRVMTSIRLLEQYGVEWNVLTVVSAANARRAQQVYRFFQKNGFPYQQYIACLDPIGEVPGSRDYSLTPERYEGFLKTLFDAWYLDMKAGRYVYNRYFENLMMILSGQETESCDMHGVCGVQWVVEADGSVYPCDFYALDRWQLGNLLTDSFADMAETQQARDFMAWSRQVPEACRACRWYGLCRNGCRRNREPVTAGSAGVNHFCSAYRGFFEYAYPRLQEILFLWQRHTVSEGGEQDGL